MTRNTIPCKHAHEALQRTPDAAARWRSCILGGSNSCLPVIMTGRQGRCFGGEPILDTGAICVYLDAGESRDEQTEASCRPGLEEVPMT